MPAFTELIAIGNVQPPETFSVAACALPVPIAKIAREAKVARMSLFVLLRLRMLCMQSIPTFYLLLCLLYHLSLAHM